MAFANLPYLAQSPSVSPAGMSTLEARMEVMLRALRPRSHAEALRLLRARFPESTLAERIAALTRHQGH
jgi:hypothetical protein